MSYISKEQIRKSLLRGANEGYSHMIIYVDTFDYDYGFRFVKQGEDINAILKEISNSSNMNKIMEVYNYSLDLESQLNEKFAYHPDTPKINITAKALTFATKKHEGQTRFNGDAYINHPLRVANLLKKYKTSHEIDSLTAAALLHDTLEDTATTYYELCREFGILIASLVNEVTTNEDFKSILGKTLYLELKLKSMSNWALDIKLCDRLDNLSELDAATIEFKNKYIIETAGIISFLLNNRKLTKTHKAIIRDIITLIREYKCSEALNILDINPEPTRTRLQTKLIESF